MNINTTLFAQAVTFTAFIWFTGEVRVGPQMLSAIRPTRQRHPPMASPPTSRKKSWKFEAARTTRDQERAKTAPRETSRTRRNAQRR